MRRINLENVKKERERRVDTGRGERERGRVIDGIPKMLALINFQLGQLHRRRRGGEGLPFTLDPSKRKLFYRLKFKTGKREGRPCKNCTGTPEPSFPFNVESD